MMRGIVAHGLRVTMMSMLFGCAHHRSEAMPAQTGVPIAASVRREIIRLDGRHLSPDALEHIVSGAMTRSSTTARSCTWPDLAIATSSTGFRSPTRP
jgi:hypothetical protein